MGTIITFPAARSGFRDGTRRASGEPATIIILPVVRIERREEPSDGLRDGTTTGRKRRRPTARR